MVNRLSVNVLLKSVIAIMGAAVMTALVLSAWDSWSRLQIANQIAIAADGSKYLFTAMHNLRTDRGTSQRDLFSDRQSVNGRLPPLRAAEISALKSALVALEAADFPDRRAVLSDLAQATRKLAALQDETLAAFVQPKAARRVGLAQEYFDHGTAVIEMTERLSLRLTRRVKLEDAFVDQLMEIRQLAWMARIFAGDASAMMNSALEGQGLPADALANYSAYENKVEATWAVLENLAVGLPLPARFAEALERAKREYFARDFHEARFKALQALIAGNRSAVDINYWSQGSVSKLTALLGVAEVALDIAAEHAQSQHASAMRSLTALIGLLVVAGLAVAGTILLISRRVTGPLLTIQEAMRRLAGGDLSAQVSFPGRTDEIGALGHAAQAFKDSMIEAERLRNAQMDAEEQAEKVRKAEMARLGNEFQATVGNIVNAVSSASTELERAARTLDGNAQTTQQLSRSAALASEEASANVQSVATASEQMTGSVHEI
ncbi:MAG TPA: methyl-accepting chemotaxis protein, partial [Xanthobacteraceae bacterium]|nr:methyl-accepting chemotaxis protein [Xanthobacteraceae bacterium]